ncbi:MAG TPA: hypothetical protein DC031_20590 [Sulfitobacter sp.]|uniref:hypothetical protein n=1 Tax=Sulfitobacter dubius TaxID=218673 RepID=UPI000C6535B6|nr:hypothetical protein [Sulfitobacter sp.]HBB85595.1 hypothetical protein [Sulfitobacter sp.]|tara:strand:+ start:1186 stop:2886 length:1701 start_codon:yes stop_codon:yes gene_type:complete
MKKLNFKKLWIVSDREKSARIESLDSPEVVVTSHGVNRTGKSSFIKSLYAALGADPKKKNSDWEELEVKILLEFTVDAVSYFSLRVGRNIAIFDARGKMISAHYGVTKTSDFWAKIFDANIQFPGMHGGLVSPMPAAWFMPFYIDQDTGLNETWASFDGLNAYKAPKDTLIDFHSGSLPKEYYLAKAEKDIANSKLAEPRKEREHLVFAQNKLKALTLDSDLSFDPKSFEVEIARYLEKQNQFNELREKVRLEIRELQGARSRLIQENKLAASTLKELDADVAYLKKIDTSEITCPTCNTVHETSFANTLRLSGDAETCRSYLTTTKEELRKISKKIDKKSKEMGAHERAASEISSILGEKRGKLTLRKMLEHESRRIAGVNLDKEKKKIDVILGGIEESILAASKKMRENNDAKRKAEILEFYQGKLRAFCSELNLPSPPEKTFLKLRPVIDSTGSDLPRLILAYHYAILHTISRFSTSVIAPIVFDTAQHQDQDDTNINAMIKFAFEKRPKGTQFVFGTVGLHDYQYTGATVVSQKKARLLSKDVYDQAHVEIAPFMEQLMASE